MAIFVNREEELSRVNEDVTTFLDESRLFRTPIIEFYGVGGIGKTALLQKIAQDFKIRVHCIVGDAKDMDKQSLIEAISESIRKNARVAIILDSLESASEERLQNIGSVLGQYINSGKLFVILASRDKYQFSETRSVARKLILYPLKPLELQHCEAYMSQSYNTIAPYVQKKIFEWTRGYPLAMSVMADAIYNKQFDLQSKHDQRQLLSIIIEKVVNQSLLVRVESDSAKLSRFHAILNVLSVPRRFNLILIQYLIEHFAPKYKLGTALDYIAFPPSIMEVTSALEWDQERGGYCIDGPMRNLFLLRERIEQPKRYVEMHKFLAEKNENFAGLVSGLDHIRYLREFFYHLAHYKNEVYVRKQLVQHIEQLIPIQTYSGPVSSKLLDNFLQFYEEFQQDEELKEVLKPENTNFALSHMRKMFIDIYRCIPLDTRSQYLRRFFLHAAHVTRNGDFGLIFEDGMLQIIKQGSPGDAIKLYQELIQDEELQILLGKNFNEVKERISRLFEEGQ